MLSVMVLRHASAQQGQGVPDHERALDDLRRRQAARVAAYVAEHHDPPELVLCSTARRARETLERALPTWEARPPEVAYDPSVYLTDCDALLARLAEVPDTVERVMLVGHNPAVRQLVAELVGTPAARDRVAGFPPGALAVLSADGPHAALSWGSARLVDLSVPS